MSFSIPMVGREGKDHITGCCFCLINLKGINRKNKQHVHSPDVPTVIRPVTHDPNLLEYTSDYEHCDMTVVNGEDAYKPEKGN